MIFFILLLIFNLFFLWLKKKKIVSDFQSFWKSKRLGISNKFARNECIPNSDPPTPKDWKSVINCFFSFCYWFSIKILLLIFRFFWSGGGIWSKTGPHFQKTSFKNALLYPCFPKKRQKNPKKSKTKKTILLILQTLFRRFFCKKTEFIIFLANTTEYRPSFCKNLKKELPAFFWNSF